MASNPITIYPQESTGQSIITEIQRHNTVLDNIISSLTGSQSNNGGE